MNCVEKGLFFLSLFLCHAFLSKSCFFKPDFSSRLFAPSPPPIGSGEHAGSNGTGGGPWIDPRIFGERWARLRPRKATRGKKRQKRRE